MYKGRKWWTLVLWSLIYIIILYLLMQCAHADDHEVYVICNPESFVYIRSAPSFKSEEVARVEVGDEMITDEKKNGKWVHVYYPCEAGEGWIYSGYLIYDEPLVYKDGLYAQTKYKKVLSRRNVNGKKRTQLKKGANLRAYVVSDEWTITDVGFIKTKYLDFGGESDG